MPSYRYNGVARDGTARKGTVEGENPAAARRKLHADGIYPISVEETRSRRALGSFSLLSRNDFLPLLTRQIATLADAGVPIVAALQSVAGQVDDPESRDVLLEIQEAVRGGSTLARAIESHPEIFPELYASMVRAGEESGNLPLALSRLADHLEEQARTRNRVRSAIAYPVLMSIVGTLVVVFLLTFVVPKIVVIFSRLGHALPLPTRILIAITNVLSGGWWAILIVLSVAFVVLRHWFSTPGGRLWKDGFALRLPLFGRVVHLSALSRFTRTMATLLSGGIPVDRSLRIVAPVVGNAVLSEHVAAAADRVVEGASLSDALKAFGEIPATLVQMVAVGEESGRLDFILDKMGDAVDEEIEARVSRLLSLLEPLIILAMGATVAFIVVSVLLPLLEISQIVH